MKKKINVLIAPNAFKGSMTAVEAAERLAEGVAGNDLLEISKIPIADGGDGTLEVLLAQMGGDSRYARVQDPLGRETEAVWGRIDERTAVIEMAYASGIRLLNHNELDPMRANTYGTGQLMREAIEKGCEKIVLGIGGSATVDAGTGLLKALGAEFFDSKGEKVESGNYLLEATEIHLDGFYETVNGLEVIILSDVNNPLIGEEGAATVFGPQKGAGGQDVQLLEEAMIRFSELIRSKSHADLTGMKGAGAAGGIAFTLKSLLDCQVTSGIDFLIRQARLTEQIQKADLIITGEGKIDSQTLQGKGPGQIARLAREFHNPCIGICGTYEWSEEMEEYFTLLLPVNQGRPFDDQMRRDTPENLRRVARQLRNLLLATVDRKAHGGTF